MFRENDVIIYGVHGVCRIVGTEEKRIGGTTKSYYVLIPVGDETAAIYVPQNNEAALKKMRRLLTKQEIDSLIVSMEKEKGCWIENDNERKLHYRQILAQGEHLSLIRMIKAIYAHKQQREAEGKRLHISDETFFKEAEQKLYAEFQYVLGLPSREALITYIMAGVEEA